MYEKPLLINSGGKQLLAILHMPEEVLTDTALLIAVGGPQTRVGSHRQFLLLARYMVKQGVPVLRFDHAGMGDSEGNNSSFLSVYRDFEPVVVSLFQHTNVKKYCFWGLCDAVSAGLLYFSVSNDDRLAGFIALNPWVRQQHTEAQAYLSNYYLRRVLDKEFWKKVVTLRVNIFASVYSFIRLCILSRRSGPDAQKTGASTKTGKDVTWPEFTEDNYVQGMLSGLKKLKKQCFLILSGNDLTADEFRMLSEKDQGWALAMEEALIDQITIAKANHTFSSRHWRQQVEEFTLKSLLSVADKAFDKAS